MRGKRRKNGFRWDWKHILTSPLLCVRFTLEIGRKNVNSLSTLIFLVSFSLSLPLHAHPQTAHTNTRMKARHRVGCFLLQKWFMMLSNYIVIVERQFHVVLSKISYILTIESLSKTAHRMSRFFKKKQEFLLEASSSFSMSFSIYVRFRGNSILKIKLIGE